MTKKQKILTTLQELKSHLQETYKVKRMWAFGSFMRGTQNKDSDVDLLIDFDKGADLFSLSGLGLFLEQKLKHKVDIISKQALRKEIKNAIANDLVAI